MDVDSVAVHARCRVAGEAVGGRLDDPIAAALRARVADVDPATDHAVGVVTPTMGP